MDSIFWIVLCLLAAVGTVQIIGWLVCRWYRPLHLMEGCHVIPLHSQPAQLEQQLRYCIKWRSWNCSRDLLLLVDPGLNEQARAICERMIRREYGIQICDSGELELVLRQLSDLQTTGRTV